MNKIYFVSFMLFVFVFQATTQDILDYPEAIQQYKNKHSKASVRSFSYLNLYTIKKARKMGVCNEDGDWIIPMEKCDSVDILETSNQVYLRAYKKGFQSLFYAVQTNSEPLIDKVQEIQWVDYYDAELLLVQSQDKWGVYNLDKKKWALLPDLDSITFTQELEDVNHETYDFGVYGYLFQKKYGYAYNHSVGSFHSVQIEGYNRWERKFMQLVGGDTVVLDGGNGDGVFKAHIPGQGWGMYQSLDGGPLRTLIKAHYDSLYFYGWNAPITLVFKNQKVGSFLWEYQDESPDTIIECTYEDAKTVRTTEGRYYLAAKIDGSWYWIDWYTGKKTRNKGYDSYENMILYRIDRSSYYSF